MHSIVVPGVNQALEEGLWWLHLTGVRQNSRNGPVLVAPGPVCTTYTQPAQRVLLYAERDANPFFHLMEALWMLEGREDVAFVAHYAKQMREYSDNSVTLHGAYGYRWRNWFEYDQLDRAVDELRRSPSTRRVVLSMWDPMNDPHQSADGGLDIPCNTHAYFDTIDDKLNMTVCCRSNDIIWGAYGTNAVHFSILLEYVAFCSGLPMGVYRQFSNNFHIYTEREDVARLYNAGRGPVALPHRAYPTTLPLINTDRATWEADLHKFFKAWDTSTMTEVFFIDEFFSSVAQPMVFAHSDYKSDDYKMALHWAQRIAAEDWRLACVEWLERRMK